MVRQHRLDRSPAARRGDHRRRRSTPGITRGGRRLHLCRQLRLRRRPGVLLRAEHRRRSARGRPSATRTSRWTAPGRCTRPGSACSSATSTSRWHGLGPVLDRRPRTSSTRWRWTRSTSPRSAPTPRASPRCRPGRCSTRARSTERQMAEVAARTRRDAAGNPHAQVTGDFDPTTLLAEDYVRSPLRRHDLPADHRRRRARWCIARADKARELCDHPVWIRGFAHRSASCTTPACATSPSSPSTSAGGQGGRRRQGRRSTWRRSSAAFTHEEPLLVEALGLGADVPSSTRRAARWRPTRSWPPASCASPRRPAQIRDHGEAAARWRTRRRARACSRTWSASSRRANEHVSHSSPALRDRRHRPDAPQDAPLRRLPRRPRARRRPERRSRTPT